MLIGAKIIIHESSTLGVLHTFKSWVSWLVISLGRVCVCLSQSLKTLQLVYQLVLQTELNCGLAIKGHIEFVDLENHDIPIS